MNRLNSQISAGDDVTLTLQARGYDNNPLNLGSGTVSWRVARTINDAPLVSKTCTVTDAANGVFTVALAAADTAEMFGDYEMDAFVTAGGLSNRIFKGRLRVDPIVRTS